MYYAVSFHIVLCIVTFYYLPLLFCKKMLYFSILITLQYKIVFVYFMLKMFSFIYDLYLCLFMSQKQIPGLCKTLLFENAFSVSEWPFSGSPAIWLIHNIFCCSRTINTGSAGVCSLPSAFLTIHK